LRSGRQTARSDTKPRRSGAVCHQTINQAGLDAAATSGGVPGARGKGGSTEGRDRGDSASGHSHGGDDQRRYGKLTIVSVLGD